MKNSSSKPKKRILVCLVGIDGSGKTTLAKSLAAHMSHEKKKKFRYAYGKFNPFFLRPLIWLAQKLLRKRKSVANYSEYAAAKKKAIRKNPLAIFYQWLLWIDYILQIFITIRIPLFLGYSIFCDRYIYDTLITDLAVDFSYSEQGIKRTLKRIARFFPRPSLVFLIDIPEEIAYARKNDVPSLAYLQERRQIYLKLRPEIRAILVDGTAKTENLERQVLETVFQ
jgi:thymidylate kinase